MLFSIVSQPGELRGILRDYEVFANLRLKLYLPPRVRGPAPPRLPVDVSPVAAPVRPVHTPAEALQRVRDKLDLVG